MFKNLKIIWLRYFSLIRNNPVEKSPIVIIRINCFLYLINYYLLFVKYLSSSGDESTLNMRLIIDLFNDPALIIK